MDMSVKLPLSFPYQTYHQEYQQNLQLSINYVIGNFLMVCQSQRFPIKFGANIATVLGLINASIWVTSIQKVLDVTSVKTGLIPFFIDNQPL